MEIGAEKVNPYQGDSRHKGAQVREMFDNIAPAYDFMNRAMTLGIDKRWRTLAVEMIARHFANLGIDTPYQIDFGIDSPTLLDVATGTGDLAIKLASTFPHASIIGIDLSEGMVEIGRKKVADAGLEDRVTLDIGDCLSLPYADDQFDCVTVAYGVRNFERLLDGYRQMLRVLRPGGLLCVIELSTPASPLVKPLYNLYTRHVIPLAGRLVSKDVRAYAYLPESIAAVPQRQDMAELMQQAGFASTAWRPLTFGVCTIYTGIKPTNT